MTALLSICIPTFNRSKMLLQTLKSITSQDAFLNTYDVEIIISDNCSTDDTQEAVNKFVEKFPDKIKYYRNETNITDKNFAKALSLGNGELLKLLNDNLCVSPDFLPDLLNTIKNNIDEKPVIFVLNGNTKSEEDFSECKSLDEFVSKVSFLSTWIGGFCIWKEDFDKFSDFSKYSRSKLSQTHILLKTVSCKKRSVILNKFYLFNFQHAKRGGYNVAEVFGRNYLKIYKKYLESGELDPKTYKHEKRKLLFKHIIPDYFDLKNKYTFDKGNYFKYMSEYKKDLYFYLSFVTILLDYIGVKTKKIVRGY